MMNSPAKKDIQYDFQFKSIDKVRVPHAITLPHQPAINSKNKHLPHCAI